MKASVKWLVAAVILVPLALGLAAVAVFFPLQRETDVEAPNPSFALADGVHLAFVIVGEDENGVKTLGLDLARMLSGEEARDAAVEDGVIGEGEDLPNDFYIDNPDKVYELLQVNDSAVFDMISAEDVSLTVAVDLADLEALYEDTYVGSPVYGVVAGQPILMEVTVSDGLVSGAKAVYLP